MCNIYRQHQEFKRRLNKLDSNHKKDFPPAFIDDILYEAALDYVDIFSGNNRGKALRYGFEEIQMRTDMLYTLVKDFDKELSTYTDEFGFKKYSISVPTDYMHIVRIHVSSATCGDVEGDIISHNNLNLNDAYQGPSVKWNQIPILFVDGKLIIYSDEELTNVKGQYIKAPQKPFSGNYDTLEYIKGNVQYPNKNSNIINMDIPEPYCDVVVDIAVENVSGNLGDYNNVNYLQNKILKTF